MPGVTSTTTWLPDLPVAARIDQPEDGSVVGGLVIIPAYGLERVVSFRALRVLALTAARAGFFAVSIDLPGDGDSPRPPDEPFARAWGAAADAAAQFVRNVVGARPVHALGLRVGACVVAGVTAEPGDMRVQWEPASGKATVRRLRNIRRHSVSVPEVTDGVELAARYLSFAECAALEGLQTPKACGTGHIVRVETDRRVADLLATARPHSATVPFTAIADIVAGLPRGTKGPAADFSVRATASVAPGVRETISLIGPHRLRAVITEGDHSEPRAVVAYTAMGSELATGPGDMWAEDARRAATKGVTSIRCDRRGLGESLFPDEPREAPPYTDAAADDTAELLRVARRLPGDAPVLGVGVCSGAWCFLRAASVVAPTAILAVNAVHWAPDEDHYDKAFYSWWHGDKEASLPGERVTSFLRSWADPRLLALGRRACARWPQLTLLNHARTAGDRVARMLASVPSDVGVVMLSGEWEARLNRAKGAGRFLYGQAPRLSLTVDPALDHSLVAERSRRAVSLQTSRLVEGLASR